MKLIKSMLAVILSALTLFCVCSCDADISNYTVDYGKSAIYSKQDISSAVDEIINTFKGFDGCKLYSLSFTSDETCKENIDYCNELEINADFDECIVFDSHFRSPVFGGGAWNENEDYYWRWYLARKDGGKWNLLTYGYG